MNDSWISYIDKVMFWRAGTWIFYETKKSQLFLRIHNNQLLITCDKKIVESLNMHFKIKGVYKGDILILIISNNSTQEIRKLKFRIKSDAEQCFKKLGEHFPVVCHDQSNNKNINFKYRNLDDVLRRAVNAKDDQALRRLPSDFNNFVKLCLLDPTFPQVVNEVKKILEED